MGSFTRANVLADAKLLIGSFPVFTGENSLSDAQIELVIDQSLTTYSIDRPHLVSVIVEGVDSKRFYPLGGTDTIISGWDEEFSKIREVDLDVGSTGRALKDSGGSGIDLLGPGTTEVWTSDIPYLRFIGSRTPGDGEYFQVYYTSMHEIIDADMVAVPPIEAVNTIPQQAPSRDHLPFRLQGSSHSRHPCSQGSRPSIRCDVRDHEGQDKGVPFHPEQLSRHVHERHRRGQPDSSFHHR